MDGPQDLERTVCVDDGRSDERGLVWTGHAVRVAREAFQVVGTTA